VGDAVDVKKPKPPKREVEKFLFSKEEASWSLGISPRMLDYIIGKREVVTKRIR